MFDLNDVEPINSGELLPDGSFVKVVMAIRPGGIHGHTEVDKGLLKASNVPGSDVLSLDCEFTVTEGPFANAVTPFISPASGNRSPWAANIQRGEAAGIYT